VEYRRLKERERGEKKGKDPVNKGEKGWSSDLAKIKALREMRSTGK
jgi:hypothetical protein